MKFAALQNAAAFHIQSAGFQDMTLAGAPLFFSSSAMNSMYGAMWLKKSL